MVNFEKYYDLAFKSTKNKDFDLIQKNQAYNLFLFTIREYNKKMERVKFENNDLKRQVTALLGEKHAYKRT